MPIYTIEGTERQTGMKTKLVLTAPTRDEAIRQARDAGAIPHSLVSDELAEREVAYADLVRVVEEIQGLRLEVQASAELMKQRIDAAAGTPVLRMLAWLAIIIIGVAVGTSVAIQMAVSASQSSSRR